jgi:ankyrin repeat protein
MYRFIITPFLLIIILISNASANETFCGPDDKAGRSIYFANLDTDLYFAEIKQNFDIIDEPICNSVNSGIRYSPLQNLGFHAFLQPKFFIDTLNYISDRDDDKLNAKHVAQDATYTLLTAIYNSFFNYSGNSTDLVTMLESLSETSYEPQIHDILYFIIYDPEIFSTTGVYDFESWKIFADFILNYDALSVRSSKPDTWGVIENVFAHSSYEELEYLLDKSEFDLNKRLLNDLTIAHYVTIRTKFRDYIKVWNLIESYGVNDEVLGQQNRPLLSILTLNWWLQPHIIEDQKIETNFRDYLLFHLREGSPLIADTNVPNEAMNLVLANINDAELIGEFLNYTNDINLNLGVYNENIFNLACQSNTFPEIFDLLVSLGVNIKNTKKDGYNCLHIASRFNPSVDTILPYLLDMDIPINGLAGTKTLGNLRTPIQEAMQHVSDPYGSFKILLQNGASLEILVPQQIHPILTAAADAKDPRIIEQIFKLGYKFDDISNYNRLSPLNEAISRNNIVNIKQILTLGGSSSFLAPVNISNTNPISPLHAATLVRRPETIIDLLISHGAPIDYQDNKKNTPLLWHILNRNERGSLHLIKSGANVNLINDDGLSPILVASREGLNNTLKLLVKNGADTSVRSKIGETPLIMFCANAENIKSRNISDVINTFFDFSTNLGTRDINGHDAMVHCLSNGNVDASKYLLEKGSSLTRRYHNGNLVQHEILELMYPDTFNKANTKIDKRTELKVFKFLLNNITEIDGQNDIGDTILHLATKKENIEVVKLLISNGAKGSIKNLYGKTPYDIALKNKLKNNDLLWKLNDLRYE